MRNDRRVRVELKEAGITFIQNGIRNTTEWSAIVGIETTPEAIYFLKTDRSVMAVRKRGFKSQTDLAEFPRLAHRHLRPDSRLRFAPPQELSRTKSHHIIEKEALNVVGESGHGGTVWMQGGWPTVGTLAATIATSLTSMKLH